MRGLRKRLYSPCIFTSRQKSNCCRESEGEGGEESRESGGGKGVYLFKVDEDDETNFGEKSMMEKRRDTSFDTSKEWKGIIKWYSGDSEPVAERIKLTGNSSGGLGEVFQTGETRNIRGTNLGTVLDKTGIYKDFKWETRHGIFETSLSYFGGDGIGQRSYGIGMLQNVRDDPAYLRGIHSHIRFNGGQLKHQKPAF
ncbi:hypothetical protein CHS0354_015708 [Potamilus streckersoni]|uniref:Uncharacterized protein n=1 Tax=Potamilus streckersoni TaxID=2493646 RepID=A0AAE0WFP3_9BIVA|nr:hypothetical protein CHS0354_015708 [Potamilus streckersoni]